MRGHETLVAMRLRGRVPASVFVSLGAIPAWCWRDWPQPVTPWSAIHAHLEVAADESIGRLDLRCLIALPVFVIGRDEERVGALAKACLDVGAKRVIAYCETTENLTAWPSC